MNDQINSIIGLASRMISITATASNFPSGFDLAPSVWAENLLPHAGKTLHSTGFEERERLISTWQMTRLAYHDAAFKE